MLKKVIFCLLGFMLLMTGCSSQEPSETAIPSGTAKPEAARTAQATGSALAPSEMPALIEPDCEPELFNDLGAQASYLFSGGRFTDQGGVVYYITGGAIFKQKELEKPEPVYQGELNGDISYLNVIGTAIYFISEGTAYKINTDSTGLTELFEARALLAYKNELYYTDENGLNRYMQDSSLLIEGSFEKIFIQFGRIFVMRENSEYGYDLLICSDDLRDTEAVLEQCAFVLSDGERLYAETASGMVILDRELNIDKSSLKFDLVPYAAAAHEGKIYFCDRREENYIYAADMKGERQLIFNRPARFMSVYKGRLIYESDGILMHMELNGTDNSLMSQGFREQNSPSGEAPGEASLAGIGNEPLAVGETVEISVLFGGKTADEYGMNGQEAFGAVKFVNTDNVIARLSLKDGKLWLEALNPGSTVMRLEAAGKSREYLIRVIEK